MCYNISKAPFGVHRTVNIVRDKSTRIRTQEEEENQNLSPKLSNLVVCWKLYSRLLDVYNYFIRWLIQKQCAHICHFFKVSVIKFFEYSVHTSGKEASDGTSYGEKHARNWIRNKCGASVICVFSSKIVKIYKEKYIFTLQKLLNKSLSVVRCDFNYWSTRCLSSTKTLSFFRSSLIHSLTESLRGVTIFPLRSKYSFLRKIL